MILRILKRDLRLHVLRGGSAATAVFFCIAVGVLFPFMLGGDAVVLKKSAPAVMWAAAVLASLLSLEPLYHRDYADGTFDLLFMKPCFKIKIAAAKMLSHFLVAGVPVLLAAIILSQMFFVDTGHLPLMLLSLCMGVFYMSLLGGFAAALTMGARYPALLLTVIILPLFLPMLILGGMAAEAVMTGLSVKGFLLLQAAITLAGIALLPYAAASLIDMHARS